MRKLYLFPDLQTSMETRGRPMLLGVRINLRFHIPHFTIGYLNAHQVVESRVQNIKQVVLDDQKD